MSHAPHRRSLLKRHWGVAALAVLLCTAIPGMGAPAPAEDLQTLPGFKVELLLAADGKTDGSWISMSKDAKGRLLLGAQRGQPMTRITLKDGQIEKQEVLKLPISEIMGSAEAFGSLYVDGNNGKIAGLWRLQSTKGDDTYDKAELLHEWPGGSGEHGAHAIVAGPDKKLYVVCGNFTSIPSNLSPTSPHRNYADDLVLPRAEDGNGFGAGKKPPGGFICRMDPDGKNPELYASGERNTYDIAFNADHELLGFDSDMEWDWGTPWYRPIRVFHATSGADQGFREGTAKWPEYYADSLPAAVTIGIGCPTGVSFGYGAKFPAKYQKAFYILDWTYGRLIAVHLTPKGSSYQGTWENFIAPKSLHASSGQTPLNLTDIVIGNDGAMYFTVGGRSTAAGLYRVTYISDESTAPADCRDKDGADARALRHQLEAFHHSPNPEAIPTAWPHLGDADRFIRYAARIAIERQPVDQWKSKALAETQPQAALTALLALARYGGTADQAELLKSLARFPMSSLSAEQQLEKLRVLEVTISRQGKPAGEPAKQIISELEPLYPATTFAMNRELSQLLLALDAHGAVAKSVKLLNESPMQEEQLEYVLNLRTIKNGWTPELRKSYFSWWDQDHKQARHPDFVLKWFEDAGRPYDDGASYPRFIANLRADAIKTLSPAEENSLQEVLAGYTPPGAKPVKQPKSRKLVKIWKVTDLEPDLSQVSHGRSFEKGKAAFEAAQCIACHRFGNEGGSTGPDLTAVSSRFHRQDILESIIEPSKVVSEQYAATLVHTKEGDVLDGRVVSEDANQIVLQPNPLLPNTVTIKKSDIKSRSLSKMSPMPEGLVNTFHKDEILDLIAYLESGGRKDHPDFRE